METNKKKREIVKTILESAVRRLPGHYAPPELSDEKNLALVKERGKLVEGGKGVKTHGENVLGHRDENNKTRGDVKERISVSKCQRGVPKSSFQRAYSNIFPK